MIRVLSANLFFGRAQPAALVSLVTRENVDIVCAQELTPALAAALTEQLPFGDVAYDHDLRGNGIACRHPADVRTLDMPRRPGSVASLAPSDWPELSATVEIVNVHISAPQSWPWFPNPIRRRDQLDALLADREHANGIGWAVLGDFNASPAWPVYRRMARRHEDAARSLNGARPSPTWPHLPTLGVRGLFRIDHCFVSGLRAVAMQTVDLPGSDHLGLLVDLEPVLEPA